MPRVLLVVLFTLVTVSHSESLWMYSQVLGPGPVQQLQRTNITSGATSPVGVPFKGFTSGPLFSDHAVYNLEYESNQLTARSLHSGDVTQHVQVSKQFLARLQSYVQLVSAGDGEHFFLFSVEEWDGSSNGPFAATLGVINLHSGKEHAFGRIHVPGFLEAGPDGPFVYLSSSDTIVVNLRTPIGNPLLAGISASTGQLLWTHDISQYQFSQGFVDGTDGVFALASTNNWINPSNRTLWSLSNLGSHSPGYHYISTMEQFREPLGCDMNAEANVFAALGLSGHLWIINVQTGKTMYSYPGWCSCSLSNCDCPFNLGLVRA